MSGFVKDEVPVGLRLERLLQKARMILLVSKYDNEERIKAAFAEMVRCLHPDTTPEKYQSQLKADREGSKSFTCYSLQEIREAKDLLIKQFQDGE